MNIKLKSYKVEIEYISVAIVNKKKLRSIWSKYEFSTSNGKLENFSKP